MKLKFFIFIFSIFGTTIFTNLAAQNYLIYDVQQKDMSFGWMKLRSSYPIETIWIDSLQIQDINNLVFRLESGDHILRVRGYQAENWYLRDMIDTVNIETNDTTQVFVVLPEYKMIYSDPYGAQVWIDNEMIGTTPQIVLKSELKRNEITLKKVGYLDSSLVGVNVKSASILVTLQPDLMYTRQQNQIYELHISREKKHHTLTYLAFGLTLASGSAAYLLKREANNNYDRYQRASSPQKIDHYYDLTKRYDRLSAASYIVFEINLLTSAYLFFRYILKPSH